MTDSAPGNAGRRLGLRPGTRLAIHDGASVEVVRVSDGVPSWCFSPLLRGFVMGNALAAPLLVIVWAVFN